MVEVFLLLLGTLRAALRSRTDLVAENLLLRHRLAVLARPGRKRPPLRARPILGGLHHGYERAAGSRPDFCRPTPVEQGLYRIALEALNTS